uniref:Uncharacterized protein n=1 Tax=Salix viminalis TaxID=40686 RepID=A0A6N2LK58_SALVM
MKLRQLIPTVDTNLEDISRNHFFFFSNLVQCGEFVSELSLENLKITLEQINSLKAKASTSERNQVHHYEILKTHMAFCVEGTVMIKKQITHTGRCRSRLNLSLQSSYFGNVMFEASLVALSCDLLSESLRCTVERIHREIKKMDAEYLRSALDYLEEVGDVNSIPRGSITCACPNLNIVSWMRLPIYKADFGWCPCMRPATMFEGKGYIHPDPANDGSFSLAICLEADHMESFRKLNGSWMRLPFYKADFGWGAPLLMRPTTMFEEKGYIHLNPANDGIFSLAICLEADHMESFRKLFYDF